MYNRNKNKGFTLLEMLVAIFVLSVGILGAYVAIQKSASISNYSYARLTAAYLAQEGIEIIRNIKDTNLLEGLLVSNDWHEGFAYIPYLEVQYTDSQAEEPILALCDSPCEFDGMHFLQRRDSFYNYASYPDSITTPFKRKVVLASSDWDSYIDIVSTVYWKDGDTIKEFKVWEKLYNWW